MWRYYLCYYINQGDFGEDNEGNLGLWAGQDEALEVFLIPHITQSKGGGCGQIWTSGVWQSVACAGEGGGLQLPRQALTPLPALLNYGKSFKLSH